MFEMLHRDLYHIMKIFPGVTPLSAIRPVAKITSDLICTLYFLNFTCFFHLMDLIFTFHMETFCFIDIYFQLFMALEALNTVGVIYTNIKLDNIMFANWYDLSIKLIDFGLAILD